MSGDLNTFIKHGEGDPPDGQVVYFEIAVRLRAKDPSKGAELHPMEKTRDDLNAACRTPIKADAPEVPEAVEPLIPSEIQDRGNQIGSDVAREVEAPLKQLAIEAAEATKKLVEEVAIRGLAPVLAHTRDRRDQALALARKARRFQEDVCKEYIPDHKEFVKDWIKRAFWAGILYAITHL